MEDTLYNVKDRLKEALEMRSMTPIELSRRTGVNRSAISRYMKGTTKPKSGVIIKMASVLQVSPIWLLGFDVTTGTDNLDFVVTTKLEQALKQEIIRTAGSVNKFASICGLPQSTIATMLDRGIDKTSFSTVIKVCNALNISIDGLVQGKITPVLVLEDVGIDVSKLSKANFNRLTGYYQGLLDSQGYKKKEK